MRSTIGIVFLVATILMGCDNTPEEIFIKDRVSGVSQKGPFINGSSLTILELDESFAQTGKSFNTQIVDNTGLFEIDGLSLLTQYVKLKADGFYFNEVTNANSVSPISLYALSDLSDNSTVNVNLLSTLEVSRVEYLISNGSSFNDAKEQAQQEILNLFFIQQADMADSELLDISAQGEGNAILLATSLILQGFRTEAELSQLVADISTDIRTDGILNSATLGSALIDDAKLIDVTEIRTNIEDKYASLGVQAVIPNFEHYVTQFLDSCTYTFTKHITYPNSGAWGVNVLNATDSVFLDGEDYSFCAFLPVGTHLKVSYPNDEVLGCDLGLFPTWGATFNSLITYVNATDGLIDLRAVPISPGVLTISFFENNSEVPTRIKTIYVQ